MLRIQRGLRTPWLLASQAGQPLSPPRALFILHVMTHRRAKMQMQTYPKAVGLVNSLSVLESRTPVRDIPKICWFLWLQAVWMATTPISAIITLLALTSTTLSTSRRQSHSLFERWSKSFGDWTPPQPRLSSRCSSETDSARGFPSKS